MKSEILERFGSDPEQEFTFELRRRLSRMRSSLQRGAVYSDFLRYLGNSARILLSASPTFEKTRSRINCPSTQ